MFDEALRLRLEQLNRDRLPAPLASRVAPAVVPRPHFDVQAFPVKPVNANPLGAERNNTAPADVSLPAMAPGEVATTPSGEHYVVRSPLAEVCPGLVENHPTAESAGEGLHSEESQAFTAAFPERVLFLDLETCGFAGSAIFLIGVIHAHAGELVVEQLLARNYAEERAVLESLWERARRSDLLITFNGKSFDWPMVHDRSTLHRFADTDRPSPRHLDVLHLARRRWRDYLPNCKLQTLERYICRRNRMADIPGAQVPQEYHHFVRTGDARRIADILHHNALDLVTLVELSLRLLAAPQAS